MVQCVLNYIAGVDRKTLLTCPVTDRLWAAHLGFSLCLSFVVVFGISFHATGYMISDVRMRVGTALIIALTVFMFDRALYQSDWFFQGALRSGAAGISRWQTAWRYLRVSLRLAMSFGLAWVIAVFLELAIFSDTISEKIENDRIVASQPLYEKISHFEARLDDEIQKRRVHLDNLEQQLRNELAAVPGPDASVQVRADDFEQRIKALDVRETELRVELREIETTIGRFAADVNAEELGQKVNPTNSGRAGAGPRYEFAKRQKEIYDAQRISRENEIAQVHAKRDELRAAQARISADAMAIRDKERSFVLGKRDALQAQIDAARLDLRQLESTQLASVNEFRRKVLAPLEQQKRKDDPLSRMTAYQELKNDSKDGSTISLFSWMTKFFIIFLEVVPVIAKVFFSPPSVYAEKIQAQVRRDRLRVHSFDDRDDREAELDDVAQTADRKDSKFVAYDDLPINSKLSHLDQKFHLAGANEGLTAALTTSDKAHGQDQLMQAGANSARPSRSTEPAKEGVPKVVAFDEARLAPVELDNGRFRQVDQGLGLRAQDPRIAAVSQQDAGRDVGRAARAKAFLSRARGQTERFGLASEKFFGDKQAGQKGHYESDQKKQPLLIQISEEENEATAAAASKLSNDDGGTSS